ncbi:MAG: hypothetical protein ACI8Y4_001143 [Candidatus Poriferisodalaceae bacterium]|jgi:hypothetical protein
MRRIFSSLVLLVATLSAVVTPGVASAQLTPAVDAGESVQVLMPFAGQWANDFATAPWQHSRSSVEDRTMDIFGLGSSVRARFQNPTGDLRLEISEPESYGCSGAGSLVWVEAWVDGINVGRMGYHHMKDIAFPSGTTNTSLPTSGVLIGRTAESPGQFGGGCWNVSTNNGVHVHLVADNASRSSCYAERNKGDALGADAPIALLGGNTSGSWGGPPLCMQR